MKLLIDFFPIALFFAVFKLWGIYPATAVAIVATIVQIAYLRFKLGKVEPMQWVSLGVIVLFVAAVWVLARGAFGVFTLKAGQPIARPQAWLI